MRNEEGNVVVAMCRKMDLPLDALETEVKALEIGVKFAPPFSFAPYFQYNSPYFQYN